MHQKWRNPSLCSELDFQNIFPVINISVSSLQRTNLTHNTEMHGQQNIKCIVSICCACCVWKCAVNIVLMLIHYSCCLLNRNQILLKLPAPWQMPSKPAFRQLTNKSIKDYSNKRFCCYFLNMVIWTYQFSRDPN
jgi:hypothetical protein